MKNILVLIILNAIGTAVLAQLTTPLSLVSTSGGASQTTINGNNKIIEWTIGEVIIGGGNANNLIVNNGEQQSRFLLSDINDLKIDAIDIYPNPATENVTIANLPKGTYTISIFNLQGQLVDRFTSSDKVVQVKTKNLPNGAYILNIQPSTHLAWLSKKLIIANN